MMNKQFQVCYNPNPFPVPGEHVLDKFDDKNDAVQAAIEYSKMYYGERSAIWVKHGRKKIYSTNNQ